MGFHMSALKKRKPTKLSSSSHDVSTSAFAAMEVLSNQFNGDGKISIFELSDSLLRVGCEPSTVTEKAEEMLRAMNGKGSDGLIMDIDEFMEAIGKTGSGFVEDDLTDADLRDAFAIFDIDSDGKISAEDLQLVLVTFGYNKYSLEECSRMINGVDQDGDGFVDFQEFRLMMTKGASTQCLLNLSASISFLFSLFSIFRTL